MSIVRRKDKMPIDICIDAEGGVFANVDQLIDWIDDTKSHCESSNVHEVLTELKSSLVKINNEFKKRV